MNSLPVPTLSGNALPIGRLKSGKTSSSVESVSTAMPQRFQVCSAFFLESNNCCRILSCEPVFLAYLSGVNSIRDDGWNARCMWKHFRTYLRRESLGYVVKSLTSSSFSWKKRILDVDNSKTLIRAGLTGSKCSVLALFMSWGWVKGSARQRWTCRLTLYLQKELT